MESDDYDANDFDYDDTTSVGLDNSILALATNGTDTANAALNRPPVKLTSNELSLLYEHEITNANEHLERAIINSPLYASGNIRRLWRQRRYYRSAPFVENIDTYGNERNRRKTTINNEHASSFSNDVNLLERDDMIIVYQDTEKER